MKSSNKNSKTDFENAWAKAFENAEATPSQNVWEQIDHNLNKADHIRYKGYYRFYRGIAAASVTITLLMSGLFAYNYFNSEETQNTISQNNLDTKNKSTLKETEQNQNNSIANSNKASQLIEESENESLAKLNYDEESKGEYLAKNQSNISEGDNNLTQHKEDDTDTSNHQIQSRIFQTSNEAFNAVSQSSVLVQQSNSQTEKFDIDRLPIISVERNKLKLVPILVKKESPEETKVSITTLAQEQVALIKEIEETKNVVRDRSKKFYANLNVNTDFFNPNFEVSNPTISTVVLNDVTTVAGEEISTVLLGQSNSPNLSFSYGINMGVKLSGKWLVESGINYANYNTHTQSNLTVSDLNNGTTIPVTLLNKPVIENSPLSASLLNLGDIYSINNSFEFASIPVKAGYIIGIHKVNLILKAGVNTDLFIRNEITSDNSSIDSYVNKPSDSESPFRKVHVNGLIGNEINYAVNQNYSFSLETNYRFALNSLTKNEDIYSKPDAYGIGMVFRYHFN
ncbi:hypothetical protein [Chondrinema litorale]|uniref:hypothetical protein n=1 Tax=Chondrinema litorale TaxID=2994555 RepID=UPI002542747A|nr:hypothetical protein [Chondrinema litorale]UZR92884.1 hypothetical protein OQ292_13565 [Chondrinema litorale]